MEPRDVQGLMPLRALCPNSWWYLVAELGSIAWGILKSSAEVATWQESGRQGFCWLSVALSVVGWKRTWWLWTTSRLNQTEGIFSRVGQVGRAEKYMNIQQWQSRSKQHNDCLVPLPEWGEYVQTRGPSLQGLWNPGIRVASWCPHVVSTVSTETEGQAGQPS
jgi:hypothetical protein